MSLHTIPNLHNMNPKAIELLEAAGYLDAKTIASQKIADITSELAKANNVLNIIDEEPNIAIVTEWLKPLEQEFENLTESEFSPPPAQQTKSSIQPKPRLASPQSNTQSANFTSQKETSSTKFAIPIAENYIQENKINLEELPSGKILTPSNTNSNQNPQNAQTKLFDNSSAKKQALDKSRILKMETFHKEGGRVAPMQKPEVNNLTRTTKRSTNEGVNPESRFFIKGVLHKNSFRFKTGCLFFLLAKSLIITAFLITPLVILDKEKFHWAVWAPLLAVIGTLILLTAAQRAQCPICNQKQFAIKKCLKHRHAHRWPIVGYMLPTALHALTFKWFKCIFCGTSVRLKE